MSIQAVDLEKSFRLLNHGPTVLVSAQHEGVENVMATAWCCTLDFMPAKLTVVLDKSTFTRELIEKSGAFAIQIPVQTQAQLVLDMGKSRHEHPHKMDNVPLFYQDGSSTPLVSGCAAWLLCRLLPELHNQEKYDLFIGEIIAAWADDRIFSNGRWHFDEVSDEWRTLHYVSGGQFYLIGKGLDLSEAA